MIPLHDFLEKAKQKRDYGYQGLERKGGMNKHEQ
jgi:hypothetical protein